MISVFRKCLQIAENSEINRKLIFLYQSVKIYVNCVDRYGIIFYRINSTSNSSAQENLKFFVCNCEKRNFKICNSLSLYKRLRKDAYIFLVESALKALEVPRHLRRNTGMIIAKKLIKNPVGMFQFTFPPIHLRLSGSNELWVDAKVKRGEVKVKDRSCMVEKYEKRIFKERMEENIIICSKRL